MTRSNGFVIYPAKEVTVYLHTMSAGQTGPYAWCARVIDSENSIELGGTSLTEHDTRLTIVGMIESFNSIKEPSIIRLICSNHDYAVKYVLDRLERGLEAELRRRKVVNLDLFPSLRRAKRKHISIEGHHVVQSQRDKQHLLATQGAKRRLDELKTAMLPLPLCLMATVDQPVSPAVPW